MMISAICIVKATRSQKPAPNHWALWTGDAPAARLAANTMAQAESASANASGNQRSNQAERRRPIEASETLTSATGHESDDGPVLLEDRADVVGRDQVGCGPAVEIVFRHALLGESLVARGGAGVIGDHQGLEPDAF